MENAGGIFYSVDVETAKTLTAQKQLGGGFDKLQSDMDKTDKSATKLGGGLTRLAQSFAALASAAAIANELKKAVAVTTEFNATISNLSALTGAVGKDLAAFRQAAIDIGGSTSLSASQAAEAMKLIGSASPDLLKSSDALKAVTKEAVVLAEAAGVDLPTAATALTATLNQFQLGADQASRVINVLAAGAKEGSSEIEDTVLVLKNAGVVAAQAGLSFEEFNGATQALAAGQIKGAEAGTALRNVLTILNTQGVSKLRPSVVGLSDALGNLEAAGLDDVAMVKLFGRENITAAKILLQFRGMADQVTEAVTGTSEAYRQAATNQDNLKGDVAKLNSAYETLQITIGSLSDGALRSFTQRITEVVTTFSKNESVITGFFDAAGTAAEAFSIVIFAKVITALAAKSTALYKSTISAGILSAANLRLAETETIASASALIQAKNAEQAAIGLSTHTAAVNALAAAQTRASAATATFVAAQKAANSVATIGATAMGGLKAAMALLGGPAGIVLLVAGALYSFATSAKETKPPVDLLTDSVNSLGDAALRLQSIQISAKLEELKGLGGVAAASGASVEYLKSQLAQFPNSAKADEWRQRLAEQEAAAEGAGTELEKYQNRLKEINQELQNRASGKPAAGGSVAEPVLATPSGDSIDKKAASEAERAAKAISDQVEALAVQSDTLGMTSSELEIYKLQLAGATDEQLRAAQSSLSLIDAYKAQEEAAKDAAKAEADKKAALQTSLIQQDPIAAEQASFETKIADLKKLNEAKLLEDQRYLDLKTQAETAHDAQLAALQEENFRRQSLGNELLMASLDQIQQGATNALVGLVTGASNGEEAIRTLAASILNEGVGALVQMGIAQVKSIIMGQTAQVAATATGVASAATLATAYAPAAAAASIASFGGAAISGLSALASAVPAALGLFAGRAQGGPVQANGMYRVNETGAPEIFNAANGRQYMMPNQRGDVVSNKDANGGGASGVVVNVTLVEDKSKGGQVEQRRDGNSEMITVFIADIRGGGPAARAIEQTYAVQRAGQ